MEQENPELVEFREQWKAEVRSRNTASTNQKQSEPSTSNVGPSASESSAPATASAMVIIPPKKTPVQLYREAVREEEAGRLDEALKFYKQAFKRDSNVDKAYHHEESALAKLKQPEEKATSEPLVVASEEHSAISEVKAPRYQLEALLAEFPDELRFLSEDEVIPPPVQLLPLEILIYILLQLAYTHDVNTIERFASVSRKARAVSLDPVIWRYLVMKTYVPPQVPRGTLVDDITRRYSENYRRIYIEYPRLRLDGVYIAVCHYVRPGLSENAWVSISHLITYHRYLRFLPNGDVLSLLANEDEDPREIVHLLKPDLRMKGFLRGRWRLNGTMVHVTCLIDPYSPTGRYSFQMVLNLKSRPLGRWNKLDLAEYNSVEVETGEACPFSLKNERPFWFSKVKSY